MFRKALATLCVAAAAAGCSAIVNPDTGALGSAPPPACTPGQQNACACLDGSDAVQKCNQGGSYDPCPCATSTAGAAAPVPTSSSRSGSNQGQR